jgi:hypothetical protein
VGTQWNDQLREQNASVVSGSRSSFNSFQLTDKTQRTPWIYRGSGQHQGHWASRSMLRTTAPPWRCRTATQPARLLLRAYPPQQGYLLDKSRTVHYATAVLQCTDAGHGYGHMKHQHYTSQHLEYLKANATVSQQAFSV